MGADRRGVDPSTEVEAALAAVRAASELCRRAQGTLIGGRALTKGDHSPVTVTDFAAQAVVASTLIGALGDLDLVGEESPADLIASDGDRHPLLDGVVELVRGQLGNETTEADVLDAIAAGGADGSTDRFWTLDPIDGTKGFLRGEQYAIALALIEHGRVVVGVLGCPNLPNADGSTGATFVASAEGCRVITESTTVDARVADVATIAEARVCESVESAHSNQDHSARVVELLGIVAEPYRIDSQCKYAAVARGDASIYLRLPTRPGYVEKIWDHAAGAAVVERAGGTVTDVDGAPLDFSLGRHLSANRGVIATDGRFHDAVVDAVRHVLEAS